MFLMSSIAYLDRVNISIAGAAIQKDYGLSDIQLGYVFSAFVIGYALFQAPGGRLRGPVLPALDHHSGGYLVGLVHHINHDSAGWTRRVHCTADTGAVPPGDWRG